MDKRVDQLEAVDLKPLIGSEVKADAQSLAQGAHGAELRALLQARGVLVFRNVGLDDDQQLAFSESIGEVARFRDRSPIQKITLDPNVDLAAEYLKGSLFWHIDGATEGAPNFAAVLGARRLPAEGGQTLFCNTYAAWEALPESEKQELENVRVVHSFETAQRVVYPQPSYAQVKGWQENHKVQSLPLVWKHRSGRKSLVLGCTASHIEGMDLDEGRLLLAKLLDWATQPQFVYTHEWQEGDLLVWDNTGTMHKVEPYDPSARLMHRTTLAVEEPLA
jgi:alpha-ketoglutarate-dependent taurine dioxygenase